MDERQAADVTVVDDDHDTDATGARSVLVSPQQRSHRMESDVLDTGRKPKDLASLPDSKKDAGDYQEERQAGATLDRVPHGVSPDGEWPARWTSCWRSFDALMTTVATLHTRCNTMVTCKARPFSQHAFARAFPGAIFRAGTPERGALVCAHGACDYRIDFAFNYHLAVYMVLPSATRLRHSHDIVSAPPPASLLTPLDHDVLYAAGVGARLWPAPWPTQWRTFSDLQHFVAWVQTAFETSLANEVRCFTQAAFTTMFPDAPWNDRCVHRGFFYCNADHCCPYRIYYAYDAAMSMYTVMTTSSRLAHSHATKGGAVDATLAVVPPRSTSATAKPKIGIVAPSACIAERSRRSKRKRRGDDDESTDNEDNEQAHRRKILNGHFQAICKRVMCNALFYEYAERVLDDLATPHTGDVDDDDDVTVEAHQPTKRGDPRPR